MRHLDLQNDHRKKLLDEIYRHARRSVSGGSSASESLGLSNKILPSTIGGHILTSEIASGGQGCVFLANQEQPFREVALKVLLNGTATSVSRFLDECEHVAGLNHPNIVTVFGSGQDEGYWWYSMEHIEGFPITHYPDFQEDVEWDEKERVRLIMPIVRALGYAHTAGIIHRDVKPANILVDYEGKPTLIDFGLAKQINQPFDRVVTQTGHPLGTLQYMSPEHLKGMACTPAADVYSLGVVLFELLTDLLPYSVETEAAARENILHAPPEMPNGLPNDLKMILWKALDKDPRERYQDAADMAEDLQRFLDNKPLVNARGSTWTYRCRKLWGRHKKICLATIIMFAIVCGFSVAVTVLWQRAEKIAQIAQSGLESGAYVKLGGVARDEGRRDQAIKMYQKAIEISRTLATDDNVVAHNYFDACYSLAWIYYSDKQLDRANDLARQAQFIAESAAQKDPSDEEWTRNLGYVHSLTGRRLMQHKDYSRAAEAFQDCLARFDTLRAVAPTDHINGDISFALRMEALCHQNLQDYPRAIPQYQRARNLVEGLADQGIDRLSNTLDSVKCLLRLARCHHRSNVSDGNKQALSCLDEARNRLNHIETSMEYTDRAKLFHELKQDESAYRVYIQKQLANQIGGSSSNVSTGSSSPSSSGVVSPTLMNS